MVCRGMWIFAEHDGQRIKNVTLELLSECRKVLGSLKEELSVCLIGRRVGQFAEELARHGAEHIFIVENEGKSELSSDTYTFFVEKLLRKQNPSLLVIGATPLWAEVATRISARLELPCVTEVKKLAIDRENLLITKSCYNDQVYATYRFLLPLGKTVVITALPGEMDIEEMNWTQDARITDEIIAAEDDKIQTKNVGFIRGDPKTIDINEADIIVAVGKGLGRDGLQVAEELANALGGSIGGTRALVDDGVLEFERQIGITGKSVSPRLLIACGISGAYEFAKGIEKAEISVAINIDRKARIFDIVDLGVVGDLHEIVPCLTKKICEIKGFEQ